MRPQPTEAAWQDALRVLHRNVSAKGLSASPETYPQVWARDTVITFLGAALSRDEVLMEAFRQSLEILETRIDRFGQVPYFVRISDDLTKYGSTDSNPFFVLGCLYYSEMTGNEEWLRSRLGILRSALEWCEMRDFRKRGLMDSLECDDWADLLSNRGNVLFPNVVYFHALRRAAVAFGSIEPEQAKVWTARADVVLASIRKVFRVHSLDSPDNSHTQEGRHASVTLRSVPYFLPWVNGFEYGERFDTAGNLLAILTGVSTDQESEDILRYIHNLGLAHPHPVQVLYPPIQPGDREWRDYYKVWLNNLPHQYHNGGIWPWVGGLYVAALVKQGKRSSAKDALLSLTIGVNKGEQSRGFNEWLHGRTGEPMGAHSQAWSAGMFCYAVHAVENWETPGF